MVVEGIDTDENMFLAGDAHHDIEDEDDDALDFDEDTLSMSSFQDEEEEEENNDEDEEEEENTSIFEEENEDEEEDGEFTEQELADFNKKLGTNFSSIEDLKKSFEKKEVETEEHKEQEEYKTLSNRVSLYDRYIAMDNETLIKNQLISQAAGDGKDINSQDVLDEIEDKLDSLKELNLLDTQADTLRSNLQNQKDKAQGSIDKIDQKKEQRENETIKQNVAGLQNALSTIFEKGDFMGITVSKEDINEVYSDIRNNKFFEAVNKDQGTIAKLALFIKYEKEISKLVSAPTHSDKTKSAFEFLSGSGKGKARSLANANSAASSSNAQDNLLGFLK